jgi:ketosteroid isomerase-like protein
MSNRHLVERYIRAHMDQDWATVAELAAPDIVVTYPQSGETIRGNDNYAAMLAHFPGDLGESGLFVTLTHAPRDSVHVISSPIALPMIAVSGDGDTFFMEGIVRYPDGSVYNMVGIIEVADGKVVRETDYFAAPFDPPAWRAPYVEA